MKTIAILIMTLLATGIMTINSFAINNTMKIRIAIGNYSDETIIRFVDGSSIDFNGDYDAWKLFSSNPSVPNIFSRDSAGGALSIYALPTFSSSVTKNIFLKIGVATTYSISSEEIGAFDSGVEIMMKDIVTGTLYNLRTMSTQTIPLPVINESDSARFQIFSSFPASIKTNNSSCNDCPDGNASITKNGEVNWHYTVIDSIGNNIAEGISESPAQKINGLTAGHYSVSITSNFPATENNLFSIKSNSVVLGATFLNFNATPEGQSISLQWSTGVESNSDYFTIERSTDEITFESVETINAAGESTITRNYFSSDEHPYSGISYYRIKLTDKNGALSYSKIEAVNYENSDLISVYPNPVSSQLNISICNNKNSEVTIIIRDMTGREFFSEKITPVSDHENHSIAVASNFPSGIYMLNEILKEKSYVQKIIINE